MNPIIGLAKKALEQAKSMEALALEDRWDELTEIQQGHTATVEQIMLAEAEDAIKTELRAAIAEIKETNNRTMALANTYKQGLVKEKKTLGQAVKMQKTLDALK